MFRGRRGLQVSERGEIILDEGPEITKPSVKDVCFCPISMFHLSPIDAPTRRRKQADGRFSTASNRLSFSAFCRAAAKSVHRPHHLLFGAPQLSFWFFPAILAISPETDTIPPTQYPRVWCSSSFAFACARKYLFRPLKGLVISHKG